MDKTWLPKLKNYPHFDAPISVKAALELVQNPDLVKVHQFLPFLTYTNRIKKFGAKKPKERLIRYGARRDAYIFSYYRKILMDYYNPRLKELGLNECVIAYRHIPIKEGLESGKSNINFAKEAFEEIRRQGECIAITLDISNFFESLEHDSIKHKWSHILGLDQLPDDHYNVFRNITNYKTVDLDECYLRLGLMNFKNIGKIRVREYKFTRKNQPKQLSSMKDFRNKIAGDDPAYKSLIKGNPYIDKTLPWNEREHRGIPQGSPISDVIANMYMLDFDIKVKKLADSVEGYYRRYSDDILLVIPRNTPNFELLIEQIKQFVEDEGKHLNIKNSKTIITYFSKKDEKIVFESFDGDGNKKGNAFEYLGFSFDGNRVLLKPQTLTRFYKKMHHGINAIVCAASDKAKEAGSTDIRKFIDIPAIYHRYSKPHRDWKGPDGKKSMNFISYAKRSKQQMDDNSIALQLRNHRKILKKTLEKAISKSNNSNHSTTFL